MYRYHTQSDRASSERKVWQEILATTLHPDLFVADMGTGTGYLAATLAQLNHTVVGIDASINMLRQIPTHPQVLAIAGDVHQPPLPMQLFDAITSRNVLWTLRDPKAALLAWRGLIKDTGTIVAFDALWFPNGDGISPQVDSTCGPDAFIQTYSRETLQTLPLALATDISDYVDVFEVAGFRDVTVQWLPEITELDRKFGVSKGHKIRPQFMIKATP